VTRPLRLAAAVAVLGLTCIAPAVAAARDAGTTGTTGTTGRTVGAGGRPARADESLQILDQDFTIEVDTPFAITLTLPVDVDPADFDADAVVVVTSHRSVVDRAEMHQTLDGELTRTEDTFDVSLDPAAEPTPTSWSSTPTRSACASPPSRRAVPPLRCSSHRRACTRSSSSCGSAIGPQARSRRS
jgi:hypothetical protein